MHRFLEVLMMWAAVRTALQLALVKEESAGKGNFPKQFTTENISSSIALVSLPGSEFHNIQQTYSIHITGFKKDS